MCIERAFGCGISNGKALLVRQDAEARREATEQALSSSMAALEGLKLRLQEHMDRVRVGIRRVLEPLIFPIACRASI